MVWLMASPASTYGSSTVVIVFSFSRPGLRRAVEARLRWDLAEYDDGSGQPPALVVARGRAEPVVARAVEVELRRSLGVVHQPDELAVTVARQQATMGVQVVVDERELDVAAVRHDEDGGVPGDLVGIDPDRRLHRAVGPLRGLRDPPRPQYGAQGRLVLPVQPEPGQQFRAVLGRRHRASPPR